MTDDLDPAHGSEQPRTFIVDRCVDDGEPGKTRGIEVPRDKRMAEGYGIVVGRQIDADAASFSPQLERALEPLDQCHGFRRYNIRP